MYDYMQIVDEIVEAYHNCKFPHNKDSDIWKAIREVLDKYELLKEPNKGESL